MNKRKMRITMNALSISLLTALSLTPTGSGAKAADNKTEAAAPAAKSNDLTPEERLSKTKRDARAGHAGAQSLLGVMYATGDGVPKDSAKAVEWYQKAAAQGNADAQNNLGAQYFNGDNVPKDLAKAVEWFQKAAAQGNAIAQYLLGRMYWLGEGVSKNHVLAYAWLNLSAAQGFDAAKELRDRVENELTPAQRGEGQSMSTNWKKGEVL